MWDITCAYTDMARCLKGLDKTDCSLLLSDSAHNASSVVPTSSFSPCAVWQTFEAIKEVNRPEEVDWRTIPSMQTIAWKTGTSYGFRDAWAVGVTPRYAVGIWVGNATGEGKPRLVGARTAGPVMFDVFNLLPSSPWFVRPSEGFVDAEVCHLSGHLKGRFCEETDTILILPAGLKTEHVPITTESTYRQTERNVSTKAVSIQRLPQKNWIHPTSCLGMVLQTTPPGIQNSASLQARMRGRYSPSDAVCLSYHECPLFLPRQMDGEQKPADF